jgi:hypothetical protein
VAYVTIADKDERNNNSPSPKSLTTVDEKEDELFEYELQDDDDPVHEDNNINILENEKIEPNEEEATGMMNLQNYKELDTETHND